MLKDMYTCFPHSNLNLNCDLIYFKEFPFLLGKLAGQTIIKNGEKLTQKKL